MLFSRAFSRISRTSLNRSQWLFSVGSKYQQLVPSGHLHSLLDSTRKDQLDPFLLVEHELSILANRLRSMVVAEVPKLASAAEYFFKLGVEGKRFRPTVLLLMATALNVHIPGPPSDAVVDALSEELRKRQQRIAEITEMIHVASLLHDDVLDDADTRRGIGSLNFVMGNKLAVLAGDFLLSRACVALASLKNTEVVSLLATVVEHLVTGETMQMTSTSEQRCSMEYYLQKTYYKTASLISNSCKAIALLAGQTTEVSMLAYEYGKNLGLAFQLTDDVLDFTGTSTSLGKGSLSDIRHKVVIVVVAKVVVVEGWWRRGMVLVVMTVANGVVVVEKSWVRCSGGRWWVMVVVVVECGCSGRRWWWKDGSSAVLEDGFGCSDRGGREMMVVVVVDGHGGSERSSIRISYQLRYLKRSNASDTLVEGQAHHLSMDRWLERVEERRKCTFVLDEGGGGGAEAADVRRGRGGGRVGHVPAGRHVFRRDRLYWLRMRSLLIAITGIVTAPLLYAMEEFPQLRAVVDRGFDNPADVDLALDYLGKSRGIQRTRELAAKHATLASAAIDSLPESDDEDVRRSRRALVDLTQRVITRSK
ncbi:hypothetical protein RHMOL_Rhmol02G0198800 [Rhododendron molle]|uniref:Uncharacterized protein n=1 Tax=Rhododendron molle TaxID=49168 RepID=A0ACC0PTP2_RHOML|nr:hypothetical protein RHMOL_Rhmol02G0198800 [Rhododendron molle]